MIPYLLLLTVVAAGCDDSREASQVASPMLRAGQVWTYNTRPGESESRATVLQIDEEADQTIVHVRLDGLQLKSPTAPDGISREVEHLPLSLSAFERSTLLKVDDVDTNSLSRRGYDTWREAFDKGEAGVFDQPLKDVLDIVESTLQGRETE